MAVGPIQFFLPTTRAADFTTTNIGGAKSATQHNGSANQVFFTMEAPAAGESDRVQHQKLHAYNAGSDPLYNSKFYGPNWIDDVSGTGTLRLTTEHASDDATKKARAVGKNASGTAVLEEQTLPATPGNRTFSTSWEDGVVSVELRDVTTDLHVTAAGPIAIAMDVGGGYVERGEIPQGYKMATAEFQAWAESTLDAATTNGVGNNCTVAPGGSSFTKPRTFDSGIWLVSGNSYTITGTHSAPLWLVQTLPAETKRRQVIQCGMIVRGGGA